MHDGLQNIKLFVWHRIRTKYHLCCTSDQCYLGDKLNPGAMEEASITGRFFQNVFYLKLLSHVDC